MFSFSYSGAPQSDEPALLLGLSYDKKYLVKADISKFFPSIYTHSIAWALAGKKVAKQNQGDGNKWYNRIDKCTRWTKNNETSGILIGPATSSIISEIILADVDSILWEKSDSGKRFRFIRHIDDYTCYAESRSDVDLFMSTLDAALKSYELELNDSKTIIESLPYFFGDSMGF